MKKIRYGYIRVSTKEQLIDRQIKVLLERGIKKENIFIDKTSGKDFNRVKWIELMSKIVMKDIIVIKELDRLGRNNEEIKKTFELIHKKGAYLEFIDDEILNTSNKSKLELELIQPIILHLLGYQAEKEREKLKSRQKEAYSLLAKDEKGRMISKKKNKVVGRPNIIEKLLKNKDSKKIILLWIDKKIKLKEVKELLKVSERTLYRIRKELKE